MNLNSRFLNIIISFCIFLHLNRALFLKIAGLYGIEVVQPNGYPLLLQESASYHREEGQGFVPHTELTLRTRKYLMKIWLALVMTCIISLPSGVCVLQAMQTRSSTIHKEKHADLGVTVWSFFAVLSWLGLGQKYSDRGSSSRVIVQPWTAKREGLSFNTSQGTEIFLFFHSHSKCCTTFSILFDN